MTARRGFSTRERSEHVESVQTRHLDVARHDVKLLLDDAGQHLLAGPRRGDLVALRGAAATSPCPGPRLVVDDENRCRHLYLRARWRSSDHSRLRRSASPAIRARHLSRSRIGAATLPPNAHAGQEVCAAPDCCPRSPGGPSIFSGRCGLAISSPPLTSRTAPVTKLAASEARKRMASAISAGRPSRPSGMAPPPAPSPRRAGGDHSIRRGRSRGHRVDGDAEVGDLQRQHPGQRDHPRLGRGVVGRHAHAPPGPRPRRDSRCAPPFWRFMTGSTALQTRKTLVRFDRTIVSHSDSSVSSNVRHDGESAPALFTEGVDATPPGQHQPSTAAAHGRRRGDVGLHSDRVDAARRQRGHRPSRRRRRRCRGPPPAPARGRTPPR